MTKRKMTNNDQKKNEKQWLKEKWQTMIKRKIVCHFSFGHCLLFFFCSLFVLFLLFIVCHFSFCHCLLFLKKNNKQWPKEKWQTMTKRKMKNNDQKKNDKQWPKEKWQTMTKRKMTNNDQKKNNKKWPKEKWQTMNKRKMTNNDPQSTTQITNS
jgi:hypothetical protein